LFLSLRSTNKKGNAAINKPTLIEQFLVIVSRVQTKSIIMPNTFTTAFWNFRNLTQVQIRLKSFLQIN
jgi:hypothetical protein